MLDVTKHALVCDAVLQKSHQLITVGIVKEAFDVSLSIPREVCHRSLRFLPATVQGLARKTDAVE